MSVPATTGGGPYFTCPHCKAQYPQGCVHHCTTTIHFETTPWTFTSAGDDRIETAERERDKALRKAEDYAEACRICNLQNEEKRDRIRELERQRDERRFCIPIHRLLTAYNERRLSPGEVEQVGHLRKLVVQEGEPGWWWVDWQRWTDISGVQGWLTTRCSAHTLDAACTAAAEQIEAT